MDRKYRFKIVALLVALVVGVLILLVLPVSVGSGSGSSSDSNNFLMTFVPIWIAVFVPIFIATRQRREKAKRQIDLEDEDIYSVMNRLVDDLDNDEMDYLKQRLHDKFGDMFAS